MSYQEKVVGGQLYIVFGLGLLLVYLVLAGQYESWYAPLSVILSVPLALLGPVRGADCRRHRQQPLHPDRPDPADRAVGQERDPDRRGGARAARAATASHLSRPPSKRRAPRFRPILMTSFAFILGVLPLVLATGAGASARKSIGITVFTRHARLDLPCGAVRAVVLRRDAALRELARRAQAARRSACRRSRRRRARRIASSLRPGQAKRVADRAERRVPHLVRIALKPRARGVKLPPFPGHDG